MAPAKKPRLLVIDHDRKRADELVEASRKFGADVEHVGEQGDAWSRFARGRPDVVFAALGSGDSGGESFLRRLQSEYMGEMPRLFFLAEPAELRPTVLDPDGVIITPIAQRSLAGVLKPRIRRADSAQRQANRLRELFDLSLLTGDLLSGLDNVARRAALAFRSHDCVFWGADDEPYWPRSARPLPREHAEPLLARCRQALAVSTTLIIADRLATKPGVVPGNGKSFAAAPLGSKNSPVGGICLVSDDTHVYSPEERDVLDLVGRRMSAEMAWASAHTRLSQEYRELRESALLDPLLKVWTRSALEKSIVVKLADARHSGESVSLAVLDFIRLRTINDRYGHRVGDAVLAHFALAVRNAIRPSDSVGRFGGDELAVLLVGDDLAESIGTMETMLEALKENPFRDGDVVVKLKVSAGMTPFLPNEDIGEPAFARALGAMRAARRAHVPLRIVDPGEPIVGSSEDSAVYDVAAFAGLAAGATLGGMYRVRHEISRGAMGVVYRGEDLGLGRPVAIKVLRSDLASDQDLVKRFREEAAMLASLRHRNLVQVFAFGEEGQDVFFVMELVEGEPLSDIVFRLDATGAKIDVEATAHIVDEIAEALEAIHGVGIIHRDVKPANILLDRINDRAVLVDVGVAKRRNDVGDAAGTPGFAAPESFMDTSETPSTDVYGLAATTYTVLTGKPPFGGGDVLAVVNRQLTESPEPPSLFNPAVPPAADDVILKALSPDQNGRYSSAVSFSIALGKALRGPTGKPVRQPSIADIHSDDEHTDVGHTPLDSRRQAKPTAVTFGRAARDTQVDTAYGHTRGAVFRVAKKLLEHRIGGTWLETTASESNALAQVLAEEVSPTGWYPVERLIELLAQASPELEDPRRLARRLGRSTMTATLASFFGAEPSNLLPAALLKAAESYWERYHTWGTVTVREHDEGLVEVKVDGTPPEPLLCSMIEGSLGKIAELAGAREVSTAHPDCLCRGNPTCRFAVRWNTAAPSP